MIGIASLPKLSAIPSGYISASPLSFRDVEEMLAQRGVVLTYETISAWCLKFGQTYANGVSFRLRPDQFIGFLCSEVGADNRIRFITPRSKLRFHRQFKDRCFLPLFRLCLVAITIISCFKRSDRPP
jgi:hypothetical protein